MRWKVFGALRGHRDDVLDVCWSPDGTALATGSIENMCLVWDVDGKKCQVWGVESVNTVWEW